MCDNAATCGLGSIDYLPIDRIAARDCHGSEEELADPGGDLMPDTSNKLPCGRGNSGNRDDRAGMCDVELRPPREDGSHHSDAMRQRIGQWIIDHMSDTVEVCHPLLEAPRRRDPFKAEAF